ncbi:adenylate/guanylate cyclase domain-containing protein [Carboxylicivirga sp. RSCT41]|uniref:adenylate/guanylate cyclase domain-containing protein n=1 Tax=Carboxylicivirga agarovorans TaxID=3417570 RepID=UPI003D350A01
MKAIRKLSAIMFTDIVGYTTMMGRDESMTIKKVTHHEKVIKQLVTEFEGELIQFYGDGSLSIYPSTTFALKCALKIQETLRSNIIVPLRIGIHIGEILFKDGNIYGEGVNIASRIESLGQAGSVLFSSSVFQTIHNNRLFKTRFLGEVELKNVNRPVMVYALSNDGLTVPEPKDIAGRIKSRDEQQVAKSMNRIDSANDISDTIAEKIPDLSIAVLPFVNMSSDPEQDYFCEGISEEIINTIVQFPDLTVVGRTSSFCFKGINEDLRSVGNTLGVSKILEGSVRKSGNRIRITAQLIEASTGFHLWSNKYDRELDDIFKIQDEISHEIAEQLKLTLEGVHPNPIIRQQTKNVKAYQLYYKGRSLFYKRGTSLFDALKCFKEAIKTDPHYALAYSGLADVYVMLSFHGYLSPDECWKEAIPAGRLAVEYGQGLSETHNTTAVIALLHDRNFEKAKSEFVNALNINPNHVQARAWYSMFCLILSEEKFKEGYEQFSLAIKNDPLSSYAQSCYALMLATNDQFIEAINHAENALKLDPDSLIVRYCLGYCYLWSGSPEKTIEQCEIALKISRQHAWVLHLSALAYLALDQHDKAVQIFEEMDSIHRKQYLPPSNLAIVAAALGKNKYALELAHKAADTVDPYLSFITTLIKDSTALRKIDGFKAIQKRLGE